MTHTPNDPYAIMPLTDTVSSDIAVAMKAKDTVRLSALRMLKAAIMNKGVEKGRDLDDSEVLQVVASLVKQRRDSIEQFAKAGRTDLVEKETSEMKAVMPKLAGKNADGRIVNETVRRKLGA